MWAEMAGTSGSNPLLISGTYPETWGLELWMKSELFANTKPLLKLFTETIKNDSAREACLREHHSDRFLKLILVFSCCYPPISHFFLILVS